MEQKGKFVLPQSPRGTKDIFPDDAVYFRRVEGNFLTVCRLYGYKEIRTPLFEETELFTRGLGEATEVVEKQMYTFPDKAGRSLTLRPEGTAPVVRSVLQHNLHKKYPLPLKLFYYGPMFRYERPQAGRERQFHQAGAEVIGEADPFVDVEVMQLTLHFLKECGIEKCELHINSLGCEKENCRPRFKNTLRDFLNAKLPSLCGECQARAGKNLLRVLDCKNTECRKHFEGLPEITAFLCDDCGAHFQKVKESLTSCSIPYIMNAKLVRGLDYYTQTVFEVVSSSLGAQNALGGGGRYNTLFESFGGQPLPACGMACGIERIVMLIREQGAGGGEQRKKIFVAHVSPKEKQKALEIASALRNENITALMELKTVSVGAQLKKAAKEESSYCVIVGEEELKKGNVLLKNLSAGTQEEITLEKLLSALKEKLNA